MVVAWRWHGGGMAGGWWGYDGGMTGDEQEEIPMMNDLTAPLSMILRKPAAKFDVFPHLHILVILE